MILLPKYKYHEVDRNVILLDGIDGIMPYMLTLPEPPAAEKIINFGLKPEDQYFKRTPISSELLKVNEASQGVGKAGQEKMMQARHYLDNHSQLADEVEALWDKRKNGEWQYINGRPYFIPPSYWFYLNEFSLGKIYPRFRITSLKYFLFWKYKVMEDPNVYGDVLLTRRQVGKSVEKASILLDFVTSHSYVCVGIQSKTEEDAASLFYKGIYRPLKEMRVWFRPYYVKSGSKISFTNEEYESLESWISYKSSVASAYDNETLDMGLVDESGKFEPPGNPDDNLERLKPAMERDGRIVGKLSFPTTVEEIEGGGLKNFLKIWNNSSLQKKDGKVNELGRTASGLIPYFTPAPENIFFDQYGMSIVDKPKQYQMDWRKSMNDPNWNIGGQEFVDKLINGAKTQSKKQSQIRKYPRNIKEALRTATNICHFNQELIDDRLDDFYAGYPVELKPKMPCGRLEWEGGVFGSKVYLQAGDIDEDPDFIFSFLPPASMQNKQITEEGKKAPGNAAYYGIGADSFKFDTEDVKDKNEMSDGAITGYAIFNPNIDTPDTPEHEYLTDDFFVVYRKRKMLVDDFCEDLLKLCIFLGGKVFPENNNPDVIKYFKKHGFDRYLLFPYKLKITAGGAFWAPDTSAGGHTGTQMIQTLFRLFQAYVERNAVLTPVEGKMKRKMRCKFPVILKDLKHVLPEDLSPYDSFVASGYSLAAIFDKPNIKKEEELSEAGDILEVYEEMYGVRVR